MKRGFLVTIAIFLFGSLVVVVMHAASWFLEDAKPGSPDNVSVQDGGKADDPSAIRPNSD